MQNETRPNFFILLELDPNAPWTDEGFEKRLQDKRQRWSNGQTSHPDLQYREKARQYLTMTAQIKARMLDPVQRAEEAKDATEQLEKNREALRQPAFALLDSLQMREHLTAEEVGRLYQERAIKAYFRSEAELRTELAHRKIKIEQAASTVTPSVQPIDSTKYTDIRNKLHAVGKKDLYELLSISREVSDEVVKREAENLNRQSVDNRDLESIQETKKTLAGYALDVLIGTKRLSYNESLRREKFQALDEHIIALCRIQDRKMITEEQTPKLFALVSDPGISKTEIVEHIRQLATKNGYIIAGLETGFSAYFAQSETRPQCGYCGQLNESSAKKCASCGASLYFQCPKCKRQNRADRAYCEDCGLKIGEMPFVEKLLRDAEQHSRERRFGEAEATLNRATARWTIHLNDALAQDIQKALTEASRRHMEQQATLDDLNAALREDNFYRAQTLLGDWKRLAPLGDTAIPVLEKRITNAIQTSEAHVKTAKVLEAQGKIDEAVEEYRQALLICHDSPKAGQGLQNIPPLPPSQLHIEESNNEVILRWQASKTTHIQYVILRSERTPPQKPNQSTSRPIATVVTTEYHDSLSVIGVPVYYAVYAEREGVYSQQGVVSSGILRTADVSNLKARSGNAQVILSWTPPPNVTQIEVRRRESKMPQVSANVVHQAAPNAKEWADTHVTNNVRYTYTVYCKFLDSDGKSKLSSGARIEALPEPALNPIDDLTINRDSGDSALGHLQLRWTPPARGNMLIVKSTTRFDWKTGDSVLREELNKYQVLTPSVPDRCFDTIAPGATYYTAVVASNSLAYIGNQVEYVTTYEIQNLRHVIDETSQRIRLYWDWPKNCEVVRIGYSTQRFPEPNNFPIDWRIIDLAQRRYDEDNWFSMVEGALQYFVIVYAGFEVDKRVSQDIRYSEGNRLAIRVQPSIEVEYYFVGTKKRALRKPHIVLTIRSSNLGTFNTLSEIYIRYTAFNDNQAREIMLPDQRITRGTMHATVPIDLPKWARPCDAQLVILAEEPQIYIRHPEAEDRRFD